MVCEQEEIRIQRLFNACSPAAVEELVRLCYCKEVPITKLAIQVGCFANSGMSFEQVCGLLNNVPGFLDVAEIRKYGLPPYVTGVLKLPRYSPDELEIPVVTQAITKGSLVLSADFCLFPKGHAVTVISKGDFGDTTFFDPYRGRAVCIDLSTFQGCLYPDASRKSIVFTRVSDARWKMEHKDLVSGPAELSLFELEMRAGGTAMF